MPSNTYTSQAKPGNGPELKDVFEYLVSQISATQLCITTAIDLRLSTQLSQSARDATTVLKGILTEQYNEYKEKAQTQLTEAQLITATQEFQERYTAAVDSYIEAIQEEHSEDECRTAILFLTNQMTEAINYSPIARTTRPSSYLAIAGFFGWVSKGRETPDDDHEHQETPSPS